MADGLAVIAAVGRDGAIGADGGLPWEPYEEDMRRFVDLTRGHPVIMGRVTYESILEQNDGPLDGRLNIVVSNTKYYEHEPTRVVRSPGSAISLALSNDDTAFVAGGETIYENLLPLADRMYLTRVPEECPGADAHFPPYDESEWREVDRDERRGLVFRELERRA